MAGDCPPYLRGIQTDAGAGEKAVVTMKNPMVTTGGYSSGSYCGTAANNYNKADKAMKERITVPVL